MNAIVPSAMAFGDIEKLAASIAKSKLFGIQTADQAVALMMIAHAEGRHPALAARDYDIIQNKPAKKAEAMLRDFIASGGKVQWHTLSDDKADATFTHPQGGTVRIEWDMKRAATAGITGNPMWKKYPRQMLRSRTVSEGVRTIYPSATSGMYVPEEVHDAPQEEPAFQGTTIEAKAEEPTPPHAVRKKSWSNWLDNLELNLSSAQSKEDVDAILDSEEMAKATAALNKKDAEGRPIFPDAQDRFNDMCAAAIKRFDPFEEAMQMASEP